MIALPLWDLIKLFRDGLITLSTTLQNILSRPLASVIVFPKDIVIFGFNITNSFNNFLFSLPIYQVTVLEILIGGGVATIMGLVLIKKLIPLA